MNRRETEALRLARGFVSDPRMREKLKAKQVRDGKPWVAEMIDEAVIVSRELLRLSRKRASTAR